MHYTHFLLADAMLAHRQQNLENWTQKYLTGVGGNSVLARHLANNQPLSVKLITFPLSNLKRVMGPEPSMLFHEPPELWEQRVSDLKRVIAQGISVAPLIVTNFWEPYAISDGSHRHEAFLKLGIEEYWVSFFEKNQK